MTLEFKNSLYLEENFHTFSTVLILALLGGTLAPLFLLVTTFLLYHFYNLLGWKNSKQPLKYILDHPRRCSTLMFSFKNALSYLGLILIFDLFQYLIYLTLTLFRPEALKLATPQNLAVLGIFQMIFNRTSGFKIFPDFEVLNTIVISSYSGRK